MTLVLVIKVKEGLVLASDSRMNFTDGRQSRDDATKLLTFENHKHVAVLVSGEAIIEGGDDCAPKELLPKLETIFNSKRLSIADYCEQLCTCFRKCYESAWERLAENRKLSLYAQATIVFHVAGFDDNESDARVHKLTLVGRTDHNTTSFGLKPTFSPFGKKMLQGNTYGIACGGVCEVFENVYRYDEELAQNPQNADGTWKIRDETSLQGAIDLACSVIEKSKKMNPHIGGLTRVCIITQDDGLKCYNSVHHV